MKQVQTGIGISLHSTRVEHGAGRLPLRLMCCHFQRNCCYLKLDFIILMAPLQWHGNKFNIKHERVISSLIRIRKEMDRSVKMKQVQTGIGISLHSTRVKPGAGRLPLRLGTPYLGNKIFICAIGFSAMQRQEADISFFCPP